MTWLAPRSPIRSGPCGGLPPPGHKARKLLSAIECWESGSSIESTSHGDIAVFTSGTLQPPSTAHPHDLHCSEDRSNSVHTKETVGSSDLDEVSPSATTSGPHSRALGRPIERIMSPDRSLQYPRPISDSNGRYAFRIIRDVEVFHVRKRALPFLSPMGTRLGSAILPAYVVRGVPRELGVLHARVVGVAFQLVRHGGQTISC